MFKDLDVAAIVDEKIRELVKRLLNMIEELSSGLREARTEIQRLRDENNRLKGEQGKPDIKANAAKAEEGKQVKDHSSEKERKKPRKRQAKKKNAEIVIDREEKAVVELSKLQQFPF